jgi:aminomethyltransferase
MVPFAGFSMPVQYRGILEEHRNVRERAGLFDVSHMGQIHLRGPGAGVFAERLVSCRVDTLRVGRVRYGCLCNESGGVVDDVTIYRRAEDELFLCVNAANIDKDREWILAQAGGRADVEISDESDDTALLAVQGPRAADVLTAARCDEATTLRRFTFAATRLGEVSVLISRTGYTGSDGFEVYAPSEAAVKLWELLLRCGSDAGLAPAGLGARDTLRLEAALPLYGHELDDTTSPLEAGLDRFVKLERGGFIGAEAIGERARAGDGPRLTGFVLEGPGVARAGHEIVRGERVIGRVTSGGHSPTLKQSIGLGYVPRAFADAGNEISVRVRNRDLPARTCQTPFVR